MTCQPMLNGGALHNQSPNPGWSTRAGKLSPKCPTQPSMPPVAPIEMLADVTDGTYEEGARPPVFLQPARSAPSDSPPDSPSDDAEESGKLPAMIVESEADTFGGTRHLWTDGVWRPDGTEPHDAEHVVFANGTQYPVYLTVSPKDGKYHPLKEESDEEKLARHGPVESVGVVFAFPPLGWQRINIGRPLYEARHALPPLSQSMSLTRP